MTIRIILICLSIFISINKSIGGLYSFLMVNINSKLSGYLRKIKHWQSPDMLARWISMALIETEAQLRKINNYEKLYLLRDAELVNRNETNILFNEVTLFNGKPISALQS